MLFNSGKINTISNDPLKAKLIAWPDNMEEMLEEQRVLKDLVVNRLNPLLKSYLPQTNMMNHFVNNFPEIFQKQDLKGSHPNDFDGLLKDKEFENLISNKKLYLIINHEDSEILINDAKAILELIREEI